VARKIAIIGKGGTSAFTPWRDESWEIWGMPWIECPRVTRLFEIHHIDLCEKEIAAGAKWYADREAWAAKARELYPDIPTYCHPTMAHFFPKPVIYPFDEVIKFLPIPYLETTISYEIALALMEGVEELGLFGIHMQGHREFEWQRPSVTYLVGLAHGMGVKVILPAGTPLFMSGYNGGRYGEPGGERNLILRRL